MKYISALVFTLIANLANAEKSVFVNFSSKTYTDISSINQLLNDLEGPEIVSGEKAFSDNKLELGFKVDQYSIAYFYRGYYFIDSNDQTSEFLYLTQNNIAIESDRSFDINLKVNHLKAHGLSLSYLFNAYQGLTLNSRINIIFPYEFQRGSITGDIQTNNDEVIANLNLINFYDQDKIFDRSISDVNGLGFSYDVNLKWKTEYWLSELNIDDLYSYVYWKDAPFTTAVADSNNVSRNSDGTITTKALLQGFEGNEDYSHRIPITGYFSTKLLNNELMANPEFRLRFIDSQLFYGLGLSTLIKRNTYGIYYEFESDTLNLSYQGERCSISIGADKIKTDRSSLDAKLNCSYKLKEIF